MNYSEWNNQIFNSAFSQENISKILQSYSDLDANWWFRGDGEMILRDEREENSQIEWKKVVRSQQELLDFKQQEIDRLKSEVDELKG